MEIQSPASRPKTRCPAPGGIFPAALRIDGHILSLAADLPALEACLALERASAAPLSSQGAEGVHSPQAVPYCDFLMLRGPQGNLAAVCRLMRLDAGNPIPNPLAAGRFQLSPLLTALRYSREGILEMGAPAFPPGTAPQAAARAARLLWTGMAVYLERNGLGFVIGRDVLAVPAGDGGGWRTLMAEHGLHPDLETEARPGFRVHEAGPGAAAPLRGPGPSIQDRGARLQGTSASLQGPGAPDQGAGGPEPHGLDPEPLRFWPSGLQEALLRGCRLACEPAYDPATAGLEFVWVASRDMLDDRDDWRGSGRLG